MANNDYERSEEYVQRIVTELGKERAGLSDESENYVNKLIDEALTALNKVSSVREAALGIASALQRTDTMKFPDGELQETALFHATAAFAIGYRFGFEGAQNHRDRVELAKITALTEMLGKTPSGE